MAELEGCYLEYLSTAIAIILAIFSTVVTRKLFEMGVEFLRYMEIIKQSQPSLTACLHREVSELKKTTIQMSNDWGEMASLITSFRDQQLSNNRIVKDEIKSMNESLYDSMSWFQEEEGSKNEQRFKETTKMVRFLLSEVDTLKKITRSNGETVLKIIQDYKPLKVNMTNMWCQTEKVITATRMNLKEVKHLEDKSAENSSSSKPSLRKILSELHKEIRSNAYKEREELMSQLEIILTQINNDREVIRNAVQQAFAATSYQSHEYCEKFGAAGQEVINYMTEKSEKSNLLMKDKFQEFDKKLRDIFDNMKTTCFDVSSIKSTLDNIDSQLDEIVQRTELGCQKNEEQCEEVRGVLESASDVWKNSASQLTDMVQILSDINHGVEHLMNELKKTNGVTTDVVMIGNRSLTTFESVDQKLSDHHANLECFLKMQSLVQACTEKITSLQDRIENGSSDVKMAMENLLRQIRFTCDLVESVGDKYKNLESQNRRLGSSDCGVTNAEARFQGDINAAPGKEAFQADKRVMGDPCMKYTKKNRSPSKLKPPSTPFQKGKTNFH